MSRPAKKKNISTANSLSKAGKNPALQSAKSKPVKAIRKALPAKPEQDLLLQSQIISQCTFSIVSTDLEGMITSWNKGAEGMFGYTEAEALGKPIAMVYPVEEQDFLAEEVIAPLKERGSHEAVVRLIAKDKRAFHATLTLWLLKNRRGRPIGMVGYAVDISEKVLAEKRLWESERLLSEAQRITHIGSYARDLHTNRLLWSDETFRIFGYRPFEVQPDVDLFLGHIYGQDRPFFLETMKQALEEASDYDIEYSIVRRDGQVRRLRSLGNFELGEAGAPVRQIGTIQDITEAREHENTIRQKSRLIQILLDAFPCFALVLNDKREVLAMNKVAREMGAEVGKTCFSTLTPFGGPCPWCKAALALDKQEFQNSKTWGLGIYWDAYWIPLHDGTYLHFAFDITESKKAEERLLRSSEEVAARLKEKEVLLKEVHHRVKNNMAVITSMLSLQAHQTDNKEARFLFKVSENRVLAMSLVHEMLYRSRDLARIDVRDYIQNLLDNIKSSYSLDQSARITADVEAIPLEIDTLIPCGLIANELVTNAIKHAKRPGLDQTVMVTLKRDTSGMLVLRVLDNGPGIPEGLEGTRGLGLKLIHTLSKQLEGSFFFTNTRDGGAEFTLTFPEKIVSSVSQ